MFEWLIDRTYGPIAKAREEAAANSRRIADLNEDLRRWVRDRDRTLVQELDGITNSATTRSEPDPAELLFPPPPPGPTLYSGAHIRARAEAKRLGLHQYRDEASNKQREFREIVESEGRIHRFWRRRDDLPLPELSLPADCREALGRWREPATNPADSSAEPIAIEDPTRPELEPALAELEGTDDPE
jgi:hypothetical protein